MKNLHVVRPPKHYTPGEYSTFGYKIFLAGSIDAGKAIDWQTRVINELKGVETAFGPPIIFNPRRKTWTPSTPMSTSSRKFRNQVDWELIHLEMADIVFFYFAPKSMAPISLLELGLIAGKARYNWRDPTKVFVICPKAYWRQGNVEVVCDTYGFELLERLEDGIELLKATI